MEIIWKLVFALADKWWLCGIVFGASVLARLALKLWHIQ